MRPTNTTYGIYSSNLERFLLIDNDLWPLLHTARLLSSKLFLSVCNIDSSVPINNDNCISWSLIDPTIPKTDMQLAKLVDVGSGLENLGDLFIDVSKQKLKEYQYYSRFVLSAVKSAWLTEAVLNSSQQTYFLKLLDIKEDFYKVDDDSGIKNGFLFNIDKILYLSETAEECLDKIDVLLNDQTVETPEWLAQYKLHFIRNLDDRYKTFL